MRVEQPQRTLKIDHLPIEVYETNEALGHAAATEARSIIMSAIQIRGSANIILATGNSQLTFMKALRELDSIQWSKVNVFHMDEFLGIDPNHRASFPRFLHQHFLRYISVGNFFPISGKVEDVEQTCRDYEALLRKYPADMVALGFGENGHIAFNDPSTARFDDPQWVKVVTLDAMSQQQQFNEGHFDSLKETPSQAITLTIPALIAAKSMLCIVPETRKAEAVRACMLESISEARPGSILRQVTNAKLFLDQDAAAKL